MLAIEKVDHIGIRVSEKQRSIAFYQELGFALVTDTGFEQGHPVILQHPSGVVLNLLGPSDAGTGDNILMDHIDKHPGITHVSYKIESMDNARAFLAERGIEISGEFSFKDMDAIFIRDPDRNVVELDAYAGVEPEARTPRQDGYRAHP